MIINAKYMGKFELSQTQIQTHFSGIKLKFISKVPELNSFKKS